jgi:hypothetical protein
MSSPSKLPSETALAEFLRICGLPDQTKPDKTEPDQLEPLAQFQPPPSKRRGRRGRGKKKRRKLGRDEWRPAKYKAPFSKDKPCCQTGACFERFSIQVPGWRKRACDDKSLSPRQKAELAQRIRAAEMTLESGLYHMIRKTLYIM